MKSQSIKSSFATSFIVAACLFLVVSNSAGPFLRIANFNLWFSDLIILLCFLGTVISPKQSKTYWIKLLILFIYSSMFWLAAEYSIYRFLYPLLSFIILFQVLKTHDFVKSEFLIVLISMILMVICATAIYQRLIVGSGFISWIKSHHLLPIFFAIASFDPRHSNNILKILLLSTILIFVAHFINGSRIISLSAFVSVFVIAKNLSERQVGFKPTKIIVACSIFSMIIFAAQKPTAIARVFDVLNSENINNGLLTLNYRYELWRQIPEIQTLDIFFGLGPVLIYSEIFNGKLIPIMLIHNDFMAIFLSFGIFGILMCQNIIRVLFQFIHLNSLFRRGCVICCIIITLLFTPVLYDAANSMLFAVICGMINSQRDTGTRKL